MYIKDIFHSNTGISQYRIEESVNKEAVLYTFYGQNELYEDLFGIYGDNPDKKQIRSMRLCNTLNPGDLIFSTISGEATVVGREHQGYIFTQNYIRMDVLGNVIDKKYAAFLINENPFIKKQFKQQVQGSLVARYSLKLLKNIKLPNLPRMEKQVLIGDLYYKNLRLKALQRRRADNICLLNMMLLNEVK